jgi:hypothetical protein
MVFVPKDAWSASHDHHTLYLVYISEAIIAWGGVFFGVTTYILFIPETHV